MPWTYGNKSRYSKDSEDGSPSRPFYLTNEAVRVLLLSWLCDGTSFFAFFSSSFFILLHLEGQLIILPTPKLLD